MKKNIILVIVSLLAVFIILNILNWFIFYKNSYKPLNDYFSEYKEFLKRDISNENRIKQVINDENYRKFENAGFKKRPVIVFGSTIAYGDSDEKDTLTYKLGKSTQRNVYNRAYGAFGIQHMLYQLQNNKFYGIVPKPEYIIYVYTNGQPQTITTPESLDFPPAYTVFYKYNPKKGFELKRRTFLTDKCIIQHFISNYLARTILNKNVSYNKSRENMIIEYLKASREEARKHWNDNNIKFIVLFYDNPSFDETFDKLHKLGFYTLSENDLKADKNQNGQVWDKIVSAMVRKFNM